MTAVRSCSSLVFHVMATDPPWLASEPTPTIEASHFGLFDPTEDQRRSVRAMAGFGVPHKDIALMLEIDAATLQRHFRRELDRGSVETCAGIWPHVHHRPTTVGGW